MNKASSHRLRKNHWWVCCVMTLTVLCYVYDCFMTQSIALPGIRSMIYIYALHTYMLCYERMIPMMYICAGLKGAVFLVCLQYSGIYLWSCKLFCLLLSILLWFQWTKCQILNGLVWALKPSLMDLLHYLTGTAYLNIIILNGDWDNSFGLQ